MVPRHEQINVTEISFDDRCERESRYFIPLPLLINTHLQQSIQADVLCDIQFQVSFNRNTRIDA